MLKLTAVSMSSSIISDHVIFPVVANFHNVHMIFSLSSLGHTSDAEHDAELLEQLQVSRSAEVS